jgi:predicted esterase
LNTETIKGKTLPYMLLKPARFRPNLYPLVIFLHAPGETMYDPVGIASGLDDRGYVYACPQGPYSVKLAFGSGYGWEPGEGGDPDQGLDALLDGFVDEVKEQIGVSEDKVVLVGFDESGAVALRYALARPEVFRGVASLGLSGEANGLSEALPAKRDRGVFLAEVGTDTAAIEKGLATKSLLESAGYPVRYQKYELASEPEPEEDVEEYGNEEEGWDVAYSPPHPELGDLLVWLKETLPPY